MIVDDDRDIREMVAFSLEVRRYRHVEASNGEEALKMLHGSSVKPSVILLDIMMPIMDGWRFRIHQRNDPDPTIANIPVIVLTAHATVEEITRRMRAAGGIRKPFQLENLISTIERCCRGSSHSAVTH